MCEGARGGSEAAWWSWFSFFNGFLGLNLGHQCWQQLFSLQSQLMARASVILVDGDGRSAVSKGAVTGR